VGNRIVGLDNLAFEVGDKYRVGALAMMMSASREPCDLRPLPSLLTWLLLTEFLPFGHSGLLTIVSAQ